MRTILCLIFVVILSAFDISCSGNGFGPVDIAQQSRDHSAVAWKSLHATLLNPNGECQSCEVAKHQLSLDLRLPLRDLRLVDPSFPSTPQAALSVRPTALLFALEGIKMVVQKDKALVFRQAQTDALEFIPVLRAQLRSVRTVPGMRFEHRVVETALSIVCHRLHYEVHTLAPTIAKTLHELQTQSKGLDVIQAQVGVLP